MNILGLNCFLHDSSAALISRGKILAAAEEERFNRQKHTDKFPVNAIKFCLESNNLRIEDIDRAAFFMRPLNKLYYLGLLNFLKRPLKSFPFLRGEIYNSARMLSLWLYFRDNFGIKKRNDFLLFIDHHISHVSSAFLSSGFESSAVISIDGCGERSTCLLAFADRNKIREIKRINFPNSIGFLYASMTAYLGFMPLSDEYKVMGLASYGKPKYHKLFKDILVIRENGDFKINLKYFNFHNELSAGGLTWTSKELEKCLGNPRKADEKIEERHADIAASLQKVVEEAGTNLAGFLLKITNSKNLCIAGGVGLNCVMNQKIQENVKFKNIFVQPAANDAGTSLGAALYASHYLLGEKSSFSMTSAFLGPGYENETIEKILIENKLRYKYRQNIWEIAAKLISEGKIIGWFQGRMEYGPRALGGRSILADPRNPKMKDIINERIKHREMFRPFAPSIMEEYAQDYFSSCVSSPFMTFVYPVKEDKAPLIPAVVHVDNTARVQTVSKEYNPKFWNLINEFRKITGIPVVINTSFNIKGEPIVCTPEDAIRCFYTNGIDFLILEDFIIEK